MTDHIEKTITFNSDEHTSRLTFTYDSQDEGDLGVVLMDDEGGEDDLAITFTEALKLLSFLTDVLTEEVDRRIDRANEGTTIPLLGTGS